jgi:hypothetical protein
MVDGFQCVLGLHESALELEIHESPFGCEHVGERLGRVSVERNVECVRGG